MFNFSSSSFVVLLLSVSTRIHRDNRTLQTVRGRDREEESIGAVPKFLTGNFSLSLP